MAWINPPVLTLSWKMWIVWQIFRKITNILLLISMPYIWCVTYMLYVPSYLVKIIPQWSKCWCLWGNIKYHWKRSLSSFILVVVNTKEWWWHFLFIISNNIGLFGFRHIGPPMMFTLLHISMLSSQILNLVGHGKFHFHRIKTLF